MSSLIAGPGESVKNSLRSRNAIVISKKTAGTRQKIPDVSGVGAVGQKKIRKRMKTIGEKTQRDSSNGLRVPW